MTAMVTGGGRGIGLAAATLFAQRGINVAICSRTLDEIDRALLALGQIHPGVMGSACDVGISSQVDAFVEKVLDSFGKVDILVNNAGVAHVRTLVETSQAEWDETINTNLKGAFLFTKAVLPGMLKENRGVIINVSSGAGKTGFENLSAYCASKFGLIGLTESTAWEVAGNNIRVMSICPGDVATGMQERADPGYYQANRSQMLTADQVGSKIVEMALDSRFTNGESVDI